MLFDPSTEINHAIATHPAQFRIASDVRRANPRYPDPGQGSQPNPRRRLELGNFATAWLRRLLAPYLSEISGLFSIDSSV